MNAIPNILEVLRYTGPVELAELQSRLSLPLPDLLSDLRALKTERIIVVSGPGADLGQGGAPMTEQAAADTFVELSSRGLKSIMAA